jgi:hypothetical protein
MFKETFLHFSDAYLVTFGFILFMVTFLGALVWTLFVREKSFYSQLSQLPLQEGNRNGK